MSIVNCTFNDIHGTGRGSIAFGDYEKSMINVLDCRFTNNYAMYGSIFYA
jgi:hypothetical protein